MAVLCLLCLLGFWGSHTTLHRPALTQHAARRADRRRKRLLQQTQAALLQLRTNTAAGRRALDEDPGGGGGGDGGAHSCSLAAACEPPLRGEQRDARGATEARARHGDAWDGADSPIGAAGGADAACLTGAADQAYGCYSRAVEILQASGGRLTVWPVPLLPRAGRQASL